MHFPGRRFREGEVIYSEWFPRGGDNMLIIGQAVDHGASGQLDITFYTKNLDDPGDPGSPIDDGVDDYLMVLDDPGTQDGFKQLVIPSSTTPAEGIKEVVRIKATCTNSWILARIFPPIFYDDAS